MINSFEELMGEITKTELKRIEGGKESSGAVGAINHWLENISSCKDFISLSDCDSKVQGMLMGLNAAHFITNKEYEILTNELDELFKKNNDRIHRLKKSLKK